MRVNPYLISRRKIYVETALISTLIHPSPFLAN